MPFTLRRPRTPGLLAASTATTAVLLAIGTIPAVHAAPAAATSGTHVLAGDVLPGLSRLHPGATPAGTEMQVGITLSNPHAADLDRAYADLYTPGSPHYHQFLTTDEVTRAMGNPPAAAQSAIAWSTRSGLKAVFVAPGNDFVLLQGTAREVERTFGVSLRTFTQQGATFVANTNAPTVPTGVDGAIGLNTKLRFHTDRAAPAQDTCLPGTCVGLTTPRDLWSIYDQPANIADPSADFGQGQQMAVIGEGAVKGPIADLRAFEKEFGLPQTPITIHSVGDTFNDTSGSPEWDIDMQASTGMAPKVRGETLYFAKDLTDSSILADIVAWSGDRNGPLQASASLGECEQDPTSTPGYNDTTSVLAGSAEVAFTRASERALEEAAVQGKTLFSSTGDNGSSCPLVGVDLNGVGNEAFPETNYPASSRYAVAVGGTVLYSSPNTAKAPASKAKRIQEYAWTYGGGGNTLYIPEPSYQKGISLLDNQACISQPSGARYAKSTPCRGVPDVAAQSGDIATNGYDVTMAGANDSAGGGTSLSSPLWMGMWARVQAVAPRSAKGQYSLGFANETLYRVGKGPNDTKAFFDIGGSAASPAVGNGLYTALPRSPLDPSGWDYVSGLGTPDVTNLARAATGNTSLVPTVNSPVPPAHDCGQPGLAPCRPGGATCTAAGPRWTNPPHTATDVLGNSDPQLSLAAGNMTLSPATRTLDVTLTIEHLTRTLPAGATGAAWYSTWEWKNTTYFASAELGVDGSITYSDGTVSSHQYSAAHTDKGVFRPGKLGTITVHVPLADVGRPPVGATLTQPAADTFTEEGVPATVAGGGTGALATVDKGGPGCPLVV